jgi:hypothetical protein
MSWRTEGARDRDRGTECKVSCCGSYRHRIEREATQRLASDDHLRRRRNDCLCATSASQRRNPPRMASHLTFRSPPSALARVIVFELGGCTQQRSLAQMHAPKRTFGLFLGDDLRIFIRQLTAHLLSWGPSPAFFDIGGSL